MLASLADHDVGSKRESLPSRVVRVVLSGPVMSALWLLICATYIQTQVGWPVLFQMLPHEIAITLLGIAAPIAFLWIVTGFYARARELADSSRLLAARVDQLVFPSEAGEIRIRELSDQLGAQADAIRTSVGDAAERLERASHDLSDRLGTIAASLATSVDRTERADSDLISVSAHVAKLGEALQSHARTVDQVVGRELAAATERLAGQITVVEMAVGRAFAAGGEKFSAQAQAAARESVELMENAANDALAELRSASARHSEALKATSGRVDESLAEFESAVTAIANRAVESLTERSRETGQSLTGAAAKLLEACRAVSERSAAEMSGTAERLTQSLRDFQSTVAEASDQAFDHFAAQRRAVEEHLAEAAETLAANARHA